MKKLIYFAALLGLLATSCSDDKNEPNTRTLQGNALTAVIPTDKSKEAVLTEMPLKVTQYLSEGGDWKVTVSDMTLPDGSKLSFTTPTIAGAGVEDVSLVYYSNFNADGGQVIRDFRTDLINMYYYINASTNKPAAAPFGTLVACNFKVGGDYTVATFPNRSYYGGATTTTYEAEGETKEFTNQLPMYFVSIDLAKRMAEVTIFNAQFSENMPVLSAVNLRGLKLEASSQYGYTIKGENLTPTVGVGGNETSYPMYMFDSFEMHPTNTALSSCAITYEVAGKYKGAFTGSYRAQ